MPPQTGNSDRSKEFRRNADLEDLLTVLNTVLVPAQEEYLAREFRNESHHPPVFIMGPPRSGTTLFMQWLSSTGLCAYPTNLLSRFYGAPLIGALIQLLLTDGRYNFRDEILDFSRPIEFSSENGKTTGALAPNEFWYFWRRFLPFEDLDWMPDEQLYSQVDRETLVREITGLSVIFDKPFALKGMIVNHNIPFLCALFPNAIFVQIRRDPVANVASLMEARVRQYGNQNTWYSFKVPEYTNLKDLDAVTQCAGQLCSINKAVSEGISGLEETRKVIIDYESFCRNPSAVHTELVKKLGLSSMDHQYNGIRQFKSTREVDPSLASQIQTALRRFDL